MEAEQDVTLSQAPSRTGSERLVEGVQFSRQFVPTYNLLLLLLLFCFAFYGYLLDTGKIAKVHGWLKNLRELTRNTFKKKTTADPLIEEEQQNYSSVLITKVNVIKHESTETTSLLRPVDDNRRDIALHRRFKAFLMYQPGPLPILHRPMPSNDASALVLLLIAINIFYLLFNVPLGLRYAFVFADRAGLLFVVNLPFLYILSMKNQPLRVLLDVPYESLNIFHRKLGELLICLALFHFVGMIYVWYSILRPVGFTFVRFITSKIILLGLFAYAAYNIVYLTSLRSFRKRFYEIFLFLHVLLQAGALFLLFYHHRNGRPYVAVAFIIFVVDRFVLRIFRSVDVRATLKLLEDESTVLVSANWSIIHGRKRGFYKLISVIVPNTIFDGWQPSDRIFLTIPSLSPTSRFQAHPFTVASAAPLTRLTRAGAESSHAWFYILIRSRKGFSALLRDATAKSTQRCKEIDIRLDGPYSSGAAMRMLERSDVALIVAGGSGISVAFPLVWALLFDHRRTCKPNSNRIVSTAGRGDTATTIQKPTGRSCPVALLWIIHSASHRSWIPEESFKELEAAGLQLIIPPPTEEAGRPDVSGLMRRYIADACQSLSDSTRLENACSNKGGGSDSKGSGSGSSSPDISSTNIRTLMSSDTNRSSSSRSSNIPKPINNVNNINATNPSSSPSHIATPYHSQNHIKNTSRATQANQPNLKPNFDLNSNNTSNNTSNRKIAVVVSGPQPMNREVRNTCAAMLRAERGRWDIDVAVEQFEW